VTRALLLDLDDTLIVEEPAAVAAFAATASYAAERHPVDPRQLALDARAGARELWHAAEVCDFGRRIGISSWEALWCRYEGDDEELRAMREWSPGFRRGAWRAALEHQGVQDDELAAELGERFGEERRARHETFEDAAPALDALRGEYRLALVTNGASCLQREKFEASGLTDHFEAVVVSGELRSAKPDPAVYAHALGALGAEPGDAVMVGDSLRNDVDGPVAAGLRGIWLNRTGEPRPADREDIVEIADLQELPATLAALA
jgi:putative hydrolase of the HAD superfamily